MKIDILTLFPEMFEGVFNSSIIKRAIKEQAVSINIINFREYSLYNNKQVDDMPYGGGAGMVLMCDPIIRAIEAIKTEESLVIMLCPQGKTYNEDIALNLKNYQHLILVCGHYEGFDERIREFIDLELSIGDYILTGGEIPAMAIVDSVVRLLPGVIKDESYIADSFTDSLLDYPTYTRPEEYRGLRVPEVLLSGNHQKIAEYRKSEQIKRTKERRPDLWEKYNENN